MYSPSLRCHSVLQQPIVGLRTVGLGSPLASTLMVMSFDVCHALCVLSWFSASRMSPSQTSGTLDPGPQPVGRPSVFLIVLLIYPAAWLTVKVLVTL